MRKIYFLLLSILFSIVVSAQVSVTASAGTPGPTAYTTISDAFTAINAGTHQGAIVITVSASTTEPASPTALLKSATPSSFTTILIKPSGDVTINSAATPTTNRGVIELAGADNVTIDGDDPATAGTRNLTVTVATSTNNTAAIRISSNSATGTDGADNVTVKNCNIIGGRSTATTTTAGIYGINVSQYSTTSLATGAASCLNLSIENNQITRASRGIYVLGASGYPLTGLKIKNNVLGSSTAANNIGVAGIYVAYSASTAGATSAIIEGNDIRGGDVSGSGAGYSASVTGIELGTVNAGAIVRGNNIHDIYQPTTAGYGAFGIHVSGSTSCNDILIANNFITNIIASKYSTTVLSSFVAYGIRYSAGATTQNIINNTVVLPNTSTGTVVNYVNYGIAFGVSGVTVSKFYNNIVVNSNVGTGTFGVYVNTTTNISGGAVDNNNYYVPSGNVGYYNAAARTTMTDWKTATGKDASSLNLNPTFASATDFHLSYGTTATQLESGGASVAVTGISTDFDGQARPGPSGSVNGGASAPDMGADEFDGVPLDLTPPSISYTPLNFTCAAGARTLTATISDASGVPTAGAGLPVLYWNINGGAYNAATGTYVSGNTYSFSFGGTAVLGDVVNYYIAAQDNAPTPNVGTFPIAGSAGFSTNPPAASTAPTTPSSYSYANILNGIYTVGATGTYPTLTAALAAYNSNCLSGPVVFSLIDPLYSTAETFPLTINAHPDASATNTLTIRPAAGVTTSITGSVASNGLIRVLGSHVIIDGSNNGTGFQNLSIQNTNTTGPRVILAGSATATPLVNVTLKNFYALNGSKTSTSATAIQISNSGGTAGNFNNILVENISVSTSYIGIYAIANVASGNGSGLIIRNNGLDVSGATSLNYVGIYVQGTDGALITGNRIGNFDGTTAQVDMGIWLATGTVNTIIEKNTIGNLVYTGTSGYAARGIALSTGVTGSNNIIKNNMIYGLGGDGDDFATFGNTYNPVGIYLYGATVQTGVEISNNSIFLSGNYIDGTGTYVAGIALDDNSTASIRNNVIKNTAGIVTTGVGPVGIVAEISAAQFTALSNNAYNIATAGTGTNNIGKVGSTDYATLAAFQAATSADANSKTATVTYTSTTDLHLSNALGNNICLNGAATPLANVTDDFDGQTRNATTPDIGADEFNPTLPTFLVTNQSACFGNTVNLTAAGVTAGSTAGQVFTYFTDAACTNSVATPAAVGAGTYYIKATYTSGGCSIDQVQTVVVTINALPTVSIGVAETSGTTANDGTICAGASATLTATGATSYVWSTAATTAAITVSPATTTSYTVTGTDANGCQNTASTTITVNALPVANIVVAETSGTTNNDGVICAGASATLTASGGTSYSWSNGATTAAITVSPATTTTYTVTVTDGNGCSSTASTTITVNTLPTTYTVTGGGAYCSGGVGSSIGLSGSEGVDVSYELYLGGSATGNIVTGTGSAISFGTITTAGTYTVVASNVATGCSANMSGSVTVSINALPTISYVLSQPNNCNSNNGGAALTLGGAAGPYTFNWTGAGIIQGVQDQTTLRVGAYTVVVTAANGCQATANFSLIGPGGCDICPTIAAVTTTPAAICQGGTATLSATGLADLGISYGIDFVVSSSPLANPYTGTIVATVPNGSLVPVGTLASATTTATFNTPGNLYVYAILSPAPADPACRPFKATQINVLATPDVNSVANQTVCSGGATAAVNFTGSVAGTTYSWTNSNPAIGLAASGTGNIASFTATNYTNAPVTATVTVTPVNATPSFTTQTFNYTGAAQTWTVPAGVNSIRIKAWGAGGADGIFSGKPGLGGLGGYSEGDLAVTPGQQISLYVGGAGTSSIGGTICCGGFNGGGNAMGNATSNARGGGGGASDVRIGAATLNDRVLVAGGGGGGCVSFSSLTTPVGGSGGGLNGGDGIDGDINATGGTQSAGGASTNPADWQNGVFGLGGSVVATWATIAGGGGGYYGGAAGNNAGGGSGYIGGVANGVTNSGVRSGDGQIILEYGSAASATCTGPSKTFTITVNPTPTVNTVTNVAACNGATVSVPFSGFVPGTVYEWTNSNTSIGLAASGTGNLSFTGTNSGTTPITGNIIVTPKFTNNGVTCTGTPVAFTITINPTPTVNSISNQVVCNSGSTTAVSFSGAVSGTVYNWTNNTPSIGLAASGTGNIASFTAVNTGNSPVTATITVTPSYTNGGTTCTGTATTFTITVNPSGKVNAVSNQTVCNGSNTAAVTFSTPTTGGTVSYSWTNNNTSIGLGASGTGDIPSFTAVNTGTTPVTATVTVTPTYTIPGGSGATATPIASPVTLNYADRYITYTGASVNGGGNSATVAAGSTVSLSYNFSVAFNAATGYCPGCVVQAYIGLGGTAQTLNCVNPIFDGTTGSRSLIFTAPTTPGVYYITQSGTLDYVCQPQTFSNVASAAIASIVVPDVIACPGTPRTFTYTVNPTPTVNAVSSQVVCNGTSTSASFTGAVAGTRFSWTNNNTSIGLGASGTGNIPTFTATNTGTTPVTATVTVTPITPGQLQYTVYSTHGGNGNTSQYGAYANNASDFNAMFNTANSLTTVHSSGTANPSLLLNWNGWAQLNNNGVSVPNNGDFFGVEVTGTFVAAETGVYSFGVDGDDGVDVSINGTVVTSFYGAHGFGGYRYGNVSLVAGQSYAFRARQQEWGGGEGLAVVWKRPSQGSYSIQPDEIPGCTGTPTSFTITVNPTPTVNVVSNQTVCNGGTTAAVSFSGAVAGTVYNWTNNTTSIGLGASGTGPIPSFTGVNTTNAPITATITVTPSFTNGGVTCNGTPRTFTITVNPTPTVNAVSNQVICNGSNTTAVSFSGAVTGTVYNWTNNTTSIGLAASGTGNIASFAAVNTGTTPVTATITVTPSYTNGGTTCTGTPTSFTITVNPTPTVTQPANQVLCNGSNTTAVTFTGAVAGTVYNWTNNTTSIGLAASGTGNIASFVGVNTGVAPVVATITVTPSYTNGGVTCTGTPRTFTITVNPTPTVNQPANQVVCNRSLTTAVAFTGAVTGTVYNWTNNTTSIGLAASGTGDIAAFTAVNTTQTPVVATITVTPSYTNGGVTCTGTPRTFTITVNPTPIVTATDLFNQRICISDGAVALNATPVGGTWSGIGVSGFNFIPGTTAVGNYILTYTYTNQYGCTSTDTTTAKVTACDERNISLSSGGAVLYPNPNGGQFNIRVNSTRFQYLQMRIYNDLGQLISTKQWSGLVYGQVLPVDMRHLPAAVYTVRIIYDGGNLYEDKGYQMLIQH